MLYKLFTTKDSLLYFALFTAGIISFIAGKIIIQGQTPENINLIEVLLHSYNAVFIAILSRKMQFTRDFYFFPAWLFIIISSVHLPGLKTLSSTSLILTGIFFLHNVLNRDTEKGEKAHLDLFTTAMIFGGAILLSKNNLILIIFLILALTIKQIDTRKSLLVLWGILLVFYLYWGIELLMYSPQTALEHFKELWLTEQNLHSKPVSKMFFHAASLIVFLSLGLWEISKKFYNVPRYQRLEMILISSVIILYFAEFIIGASKFQISYILVSLAGFPIAYYLVGLEKKPAFKEVMLWILLAGTLYLFL